MSLILTILVLLRWCVAFDSRLASSNSDLFFFLRFYAVDGGFWTILFSLIGDLARYSDSWTSMRSIFLLPILLSFDSSCSKVRAYEDCWLITFAEKFGLISSSIAMSFRVWRFIVEWPAPGDASVANIPITVTGLVYLLSISKLFLMASLFLKSRCFSIFYRVGVIYSCSLPLPCF